MHAATIEWLLQGEPWVESRTRLDLLGQPDTHPQVIAARKAMRSDPKVKALLAELADWPGTVLSKKGRAPGKARQSGILAGYARFQTEKRYRKL